MDSSPDSVGIDVPESVLVLPDALKLSLGSLCQDIVSHSTRIDEIEAQLEALAKQAPVVARLLSVPGIGLLTATALLLPSSERHSR